MRYYHLSSRVSTIIRSYQSNLFSLIFARNHCMSNIPPVASDSNVAMGAFDTNEDRVSMIIPSPKCEGMVEIPEASVERARLNSLTSKDSNSDTTLDPLRSRHIMQGLALTVGSALGQTPPSEQQCLDAFLLPNKSDLTAGARAWSKHAHRSGRAEEGTTGWWGTPKGPVAIINARALELFWRVMKAATWRNLHWLPHTILVYEIRVLEGYGMRWSQDRALREDTDDDINRRPWVLRGFVEPMMEGGHEVGWRH